MEINLFPLGALREHHYTRVDDKMDADFAHLT